MNSTTPRVALWDHARFALIVLVVIGHVLTTVRLDHDLAYAIYVWIFLFHMPAMLFLSGRFTTPEVTPKTIRSTWQLLVVWLTWEGIWAVIRFVADGKIPSSNWLVTPAWTLWFLVSLATLRIILPYIVRLRFPLTTSIVVALAAGLLPAIGPAFSASRTLCFLPFFIAGWMARDRGWFEHTWVRERVSRLRIASLVVLAAVFALLALIPDLSTVFRLDSWLTWRDGYAALIDDTNLTLVGALALRLGLLIVAAILTVAMVLLVSRTPGRTTHWGTRTLYVYLLHGPVIYVLRSTGLIGQIEALGWFGVPLLVLTGVFIAMALSTAVVARVFKPIIEPTFEWIMRPKGPLRGREQSASQP